MSERAALSEYRRFTSLRMFIPQPAQVLIEQLIEENLELTLQDLATRIPIRYMTVKRVAETAENQFILLKTHKKP